MTHQLKKLKSDENDNDLGSSATLTWAIQEEGESQISKKRQGIFPEQRSPKKGKPAKPRKLVAPKRGKLGPQSETLSSEDEDDKTPSSAPTIASRLLTIAAEERVSDTEMEVVPVGKAVSESSARLAKSSGYDSDSSAGSADTDEILSNNSASKKGSKVASGKLKNSTKTSPKNVNKSVEPSKKSEKKERSEGRSAAAKQSKDQKSPTTTKKTALERMGDKSEQTDKTAAVFQEQFKFVKPTAQGKSFRKAASLARTPPFRGLGMLAEDDDVKNDPNVTPTPLDSPSNNKEEHDASKTMKKTQKKVVVDTKKQLLDSKLSDSLETGKATNVPGSLSGPLDIKSQKKMRGSKEITETAGEATTTKIVEVSRKRKTSELSVEHTNLATSPDSTRVPDAMSIPSKKKKAVKQVPESDSDLDDNDFEKVGKKLAALAKQQEDRLSKSTEKVKKPKETNSPEKKSSVDGMNAMVSISLYIYFT
jgi:hypothetical protein